MIKQSGKGLNSRSECNVFDENGFLPIMTAPMYSVVDATNYKYFLDNKIKVCMSREEFPEGILPLMQNESYFESVSLDDFIRVYVLRDNYLVDKECICIDTANGNMPILHKAIIDAKTKHGKKLVIIAGNVSTKEAFAELASTGVDYIRVGIGGGGGCNTTLNTGVGQENLETLVKECYSLIKDCNSDMHNRSVDNYFLAKKYSGPEWNNITKCKIIADGISTFNKQLMSKGQAMENSYAAINRLLYAGASIVMIGKTFTQSLESAPLKYYKNGQDTIVLDIATLGILKNYYDSSKELFCEYYGMSTLKAQEKYNKEGKKKHSEGSIQDVKVLWTLDEWLNGSIKNSDNIPGFIPCLKSAMSYTGSKDIKNFKIYIDK